MFQFFSVEIRKAREPKFAVYQPCDPYLSASEASFSQWGAIQIQLSFLPFTLPVSNTTMPRPYHGTFLPNHNKRRIRELPSHHSRQNFAKPGRLAVKLRSLHRTPACQHGTFIAWQRTGYRGRSRGLTSQLAFQCSPPTCSSVDKRSLLDGVHGGIRGHFPLFVISPDSSLLFLNLKSYSFTAGHIIRLKEIVSTIGLNINFKKTKTYFM